MLAQQVVGTQEVLPVVFADLTTLIRMQHDLGLGRHNHRADALGCFSKRACQDERQNLAGLVVLLMPFIGGSVGERRHDHGLPIQCAMRYGTHRFHNDAIALVPTLAE